METRQQLAVSLDALSLAYAALRRATEYPGYPQTGPLGAQASLFLRGADSRQVLVLVDGVPFARADFGTASWQYLPLDQIERIEIVRGNHSSVYGAQAIGGVVHVITRRAQCRRGSAASAPASSVSLPAPEGPTTRNSRPVMRRPWG